MALRLVAVLCLWVLMVTADNDDWTSKCSKCKCTWSSGKKTADCRSVHFNEIPLNLSSELRDIDFSNNSFYELKTKEFSSAGLANVHKLKLQYCSIENVHPLTFDGLKLLIDLDLSRNSIKELDSKVFADNSRLRIINLSHNKLKKLENNMFENMIHLQQIFADNNQLEYISEYMFGENSSLLHLSLENNRLTHMSVNFSNRLRKLGSLVLAGNPWICDCKLQPFRKIAHDNNWITKSTECDLPERLKGRTWSDSSVIFACNPKIVVPSPGAVLEADTTNYTIPCKVEGEPRPSVVWYWNGRSVDTQRNGMKYFITSTKETPYWDNLTIINIHIRDRGEYKCIATNAGGSDERNVTVYLKGTDNFGGGASSSTSMSNIVIMITALSVGSVILLIIIILIICCFCKRNGRNRGPMSKNRHLSQDEFINLDGRPGEMEKALITDVNPILKPPRQYSVPPSVTSGGTEVSEAKKMLIDDESIFNGDEETRCYDYISRGQLKSQNNLDADYRNENQYPPDLLSFPPRTLSQISPAGSSASTVADTSRLPLNHGLQSPIHSPIYDTANLYRTLPYSRSHSPFTSPHGAPIRVPRQGAYVTIPRRPRASWSSEPPNMNLSDIGEPLYDNLGLRTTATGASALSLNKLAENNTSTPRGPRTAFPLSPQPCDPIAEHESSPPMAATLPRSGQRNLNADAIRGSWARSPDNDSRRESTASLLPTDGKSPKVPPRPPPKPKKKIVTGPLFEDEGEDGTEV
ncbi:PREDICTED: amphoterin-induced protein 2 [Nicrophorus vespilloides]|uniref:Amphoterin-induced protein 2 n=1 Tax=Nicrophorus vespilloides TaxID=110193 RepID=A0ABM1N5C9_NICVS|nr:PREDICTED: amphoterin-induced protein 2 [Nicrophorus vespilloides]XP_017782027.1 PREDICTED: amphoterin-induced protein 2 [Nicrophorus vespilloides]XP_017782028.1 PREDICTED: amphoterin-induced protein 2 [Nicrophorus vespilloides]XP_017782029.1 PREDICTED: amphoterin-induced protein 2 [Nicrophorus vespilloides]XP_017782031.1 PREDICTED: amphoterin-induced protein 2 [Nicrophorus vespilloides]